MGVDRDSPASCVLCRRTFDGHHDQTKEQTIFAYERHAPACLRLFARKKIVGRRLTVRCGSLLGEERLYGKIAKMSSRKASELLFLVEFDGGGFEWTSLRGAELDARLVVATTGGKRARGSDAGRAENDDDGDDDDDDDDNDDDDDDDDEEEEDGASPVPGGKRSGGRSSAATTPATATSPVPHRAQSALMHERAGVLRRLIDGGKASKLVPLHTAVVAASNSERSPFATFVVANSRFVWDALVEIEHAQAQAQAQAAQMQATPSSASEQPRTAAAACSFTSGVLSALRLAHARRDWAVAGYEALPRAIRDLRSRFHRRGTSGSSSGERKRWRR